MKRRSPDRVREPVQIYVTSEERRLLDRLAAETGLPRAEVLRRGLRSFAREQPLRDSPMLRLVRELTDADWPADIGREHDRYLAEAYRDTHAPPPAKRRKR